MSNVKKVYQPLIELLKSNQECKIKTLLPQILEMVESKQTQKTFKTDPDGNITHIFCYYHKLWEPLDQVEYGKKANSTTGLNTMCKEGTSNWTKQQRDFKKAKSAILDDVINGTLAPTEVEDKISELELEKDKIMPRADNIGLTDEEMA